MTSIALMDKVSTFQQVAGSTYNWSFGLEEKVDEIEEKNHLVIEWNGMFFFFFFSHVFYAIV